MRKLSLLGVLITAGCGSTTSTVTKTVATPAATGGSSATSTTKATGPVETLRVTSPSMGPTLKVEQVVTVSLDPNYVLQVGDIVLFHPPAGADPATPVCGNPDQGAGHAQVCDMPTPQESSQSFIKYVVAGPGDTVSILDGHVIRNGVQERDSGYTEPCGGDSTCTYPTPVTIPSGEYFLLGDTRGASDGSRFWGPCRERGSSGRSSDNNRLPLLDQRGGRWAAGRRRRVG